MKLPSKIYVVWFQDFGKKNKTHYSKKNRRFYTSSAHVMQYLMANRMLEEPVVYLIEPGQDWVNVTSDFLRKLKYADA